MVSIKVPMQFRFRYWQQPSLRRPPR